MSAAIEYRPISLLFGPVPLGKQPSVLLCVLAVHLPFPAGDVPDYTKPVLDILD
jgi:hypothetical protein